MINVTWTNSMRLVVLAQIVLSVLAVAYALAA